MARVEDLELSSGGAIVPGRLADDALLSLLASMASTDGTIDARELDFLAKVRRDLDRDALEEWVHTEAGPVDLAGLAQAITSPDDRWKTLRFAARMAWKDGKLADSERAFLSRLAGALSLGAGAVERALREMSPDDGERFTAERLLRVLMDVRWDAVQLASGALCSEDLLAVTPPGTEVVARVGLERVEVMGLCTGGLVARFQEGAAFLAWSELVTYTRERGLGSALKLHTEDGRSWALVDQRLSGVSTLLDRLLDLDEGKPRANRPKIDTLRGD